MPHKRTQQSSTVAYPYAPKDGVIAYVAANNRFIQAAMTYACQYSLDATMPTGSVIVIDDRIVGRGANGSDYHLTHPCERIKQRIPTGQGYELCAGCHPRNHSEPRAIDNALATNQDLSHAVLFLWGHWWCCEACWNRMLDCGIKTVYLLEQSEVLFNKQVEGNIVGQQCRIQL